VALPAGNAITFWTGNAVRAIIAAGALLLTADRVGAERLETAMTGVGRVDRSRRSKSKRRFPRCELLRCGLTTTLGEYCVNTNCNLDDEKGLFV
jgi:hypothetical protein